MIRLPIPGSDGGKWGELLNDFLRVAHNDNGQLKSGTVSTPHLVNGSVTSGKLAEDVINLIQTAAGSGADGREVELRVDTGHIQWRYAGGSDSWVNLIALADLRGTQGPKGDQGETGPAGTTSWNGITDKPTVIASGSTQAEARGAIGAQPAATGTPDGTKFLADDNTWRAIPGSGSAELNFAPAIAIITGGEV